MVLYSTTGQEIVHTALQFFSWFQQLFPSEATHRFTHTGMPLLPSSRLVSLCQW